MAYNLADPFPDWTAAEVLAEYKKLQKEMMAGKTLTGFTSGDVGGQKSVSQSFKQREDLFRQSLYAKDQDTYADYAEIGQNVTAVAFHTSVSASEE